MKPRAALPAVLLALLLLGCGDDSGSGGSGASPDSDAPASTTLPDDGGTTIPDLPRNDDPSAVRCTAPPQGVFDATAVVGLPLEKAEATAEQKGCSVRMVERDGEQLAVTQDFRPDRVNVAIRDGEVTRIVGIG